MPAYPHLAHARRSTSSGIQTRVDAMAMLGVPYGDAVNRAPEMARAQAAADRRGRSRQQGGPAGLDDKEIVAIVAYMQRLGSDIKRPTVTAKIAQ